MAHRTKSTQLQIRVSAAQKSAIQRDARLAGMDMSAYVLERVLPEPAAQFRDLTAACDRAAAPAFAFAALNRFLSRLLAAGLRDAVRTAPAEFRSRFVANYVAAMVEQACARNDLPSPDWTRSIDPLPSPVFGSSLASLRLHLLTHSPPSFRRRNIFIDSSIGSQV